MSFCQPGETAWRSRQRRLPVAMSSGAAAFWLSFALGKIVKPHEMCLGCSNSCPVYAVALSGALLRILQTPGESVPLSSPWSLLFHLRQCLEKGLTSFVPSEWIFHKDLQLILSEVGPLDILAELLGVPRIFCLLLGPPARCASGRTSRNSLLSICVKSVWSLLTTGKKYWRGRGNLARKLTFRKW